MNANIKDFHDYIIYDAMANMSGISSKKMFGGYSLYKDGIIFAIITSDGQLYFKINDSNRDMFKKHGSHPFIYKGYKLRKAIEMPYWTLPEEILENKDELAKWIDSSVIISSR